MTSGYEFRDPDYGTFRKVTGTELPLTYEALGISADRKLSLCRYKEKYTDDRMTDDLVFERFDPVPYFEELLKKVPGEYEILTTLFRNSRNKYGKAYLNLLRKMAGDTYAYERLKVAGNPDTPADILRALSHDSDEDVRKAAVSNLGERSGNLPVTK